MADMYEYFFLPQKFRSLFLCILFCLRSFSKYYSVLTTLYYLYVPTLKKIFFTRIFLFFQILHNALLYSNGMNKFSLYMHAIAYTYF